MVVDYGMVLVTLTFGIEVGLPYWKEGIPLVGVVCGIVLVTLTLGMAVDCGMVLVTLTFGIEADALDLLFPTRGSKGVDDDAPTMKLNPNVMPNVPNGDIWIVVLYVGMPDGIIVLT